MDGGNVFDNGQAITFNNLRYSYGFGLSWISPIGPLKLSMGFPLVRRWAISTRNSSSRSVRRSNDGESIGSERFIVVKGYDIERYP